MLIKKGLKGFCGGLGILIGLGVSGLMGGQERPPVVGEVVVEFLGVRNASDEIIYSNIKVKEGEELDQAKVSQSIRALYGTKLFDLIEVGNEMNGADKVKVVFKLKAKVRIEVVKVEGNRGVPTKKVMKELTVKVKDLLDEGQINGDVQKLVEFYRKRGYHEAKVGYRLEEGKSGVKNVVIFEVKEGVKVKVTRITFSGHEPVKVEALKDAMETKTWNLFSFFTGKGRFNEDQLKDDVQKLKDHFRDEGYLDVAIPEDGVEIRRRGSGSVELHFKVEKGARYYTGKVSLSGYRLFTEEGLRKCLLIKEGDVFSPKRVEDTLENLRYKYGQVGYLETGIKAERVANLETGKIDLVFSIEEGEQYYLESIMIQGNTATKSNVILRELALAPGDVFDLVRMKNSEARLENTRYFDEVILTPEASNIPGKKNLLIAVKESKTTSIAFSVSFSTVESFVGTVELRQGNFDYKNYRNFFKGAGQKFRIRARLGKKTSELMLNFEEPWVCERELTFGASAFRTESKYNSSMYHETRLGLSFYLRKRLFELVDGDVGYKVEKVQITHIKDTAPQFVKDEHGSRVISSVNFGLGRDTRDNLVYPTEGSLVTLGSQVAGGILGGRTNFVRLEAAAAGWWKVFDEAEQVFMVGGRTGTLMGYGKRSIPFYEKYYLGGPDDLRGYDYRGVGPQVGDEAKGGNTLAYLTAEYSIRVMDPVRFVVFYDIGFLNEKSTNWNFKNYYDDYGVGLRIYILGAPIRLDLGMPIHRGREATGKKKPQFNFSFGTTF